MKRFKDLTSRTTNASQRGGGISSGINNMNTLDVKNAVVMGRKTWESIPPKFRPLPNRWNVVLTTNPSAVGEASSDDDTSAVRIECDLELAMSKLQDDDRVDKIFVIGGGQVYRQALDLGLVNRIYYTEVANLPGSSDDEAAGTAGKFDTYFPELDEKVWRKVDAAEAGDKENGLGGPEPSVTTGDGLFLVDGSSGLHYRFVEYRRRNVEELQYLDLCRDIMEGGVRRGDRTGTGTLSKFGTQMRFSLRNGRLPLLTTKRTFWRGVAEELLWFISVRLSCVRGRPARRLLFLVSLAHRDSPADIPTPLLAGMHKRQRPCRKGHSHLGWERLSRVPR
jgi:dihydrofolate reductase/thymidylate synthase